MTLKNPYTQEDNQIGLLNYGFVTLGLLAFEGVLILIYSFSYLLNSIVPEQILCLFDLTKNGNIFQWFLAAIWLKIAIDSRIIFLLTKGIEPQIVKRSLWLFVAITAVFFSMNSVCSINSVLCELVKKSFLFFSPSEITIQIFVRSFHFFCMILAVIIICMFYKSLSCFNYRKNFLFLILMISFLTFLLAYSIKDSSNSLRSQENSPNLVTQVEDKNNQETLAENSDKKHLTAIPVRNVSDSKEVNEIANHEKLPDSAKTPELSSPDKSKALDEQESLAESTKTNQTGNSDESEKQLSSNVEEESDLSVSDSDLPWKRGENIQLEELLGWKKSLEQNLHLSKNIEEYCGFQGSLESRIIPQNSFYDVLRWNVSLHYGIYGFAVIFFYVVIFMILRSLKISRELLKNELLRKSTILSFMENQEKKHKMYL